MVGIMKNTISVIKDIKVLQDTAKYRLSLVKLDNLDVTTFDKAISDHFKMGDKVEIDYEETEKYKTIKSIKQYIEGSKEVYEKVSEQISNSINQPVDKKITEMIENNIFSSDFELSGKKYEITIKEK